jgi:hypothetical protein
MPIVVSSPSSELLIYCQRHITDTPTPSGPKQRISNAKQISTQTPKDTLPINTTRVQLSLSLLSGKKKKQPPPRPGHETTTKKRTSHLY